MLMNEYTDCNNMQSQISLVMSEIPHPRELMATSAEIDGLLSLRFGDDGGIWVIEFDRSHVDFNGRRNFFGLDCSLLCHKSLNEER